MSSVRPRRRKHTLATRTMAGVVGLIAVVLVVLTGATYAIASRIVDSQLEENLGQIWQRTNGYLTERAPTSSPGHVIDPDDLEDYFDDDDFDDDELGSYFRTPDQLTERRQEARDPLKTPGLPIGAIIYVTGTNSVRSGIVGEEGTTEALTSADEEQIASALTAAPDTSDESGPNLKELTLAGENYLVQIAPVENAASEASSDGGMLVAALPTEDADQTNSNLLILQSAGSAGALLIVGLGVWWWTRRSLKPLHSVAASAAKVSEVPMEAGAVDLGNYRVPDKLAQPTDEVGDVGFALNQLIDSVDSALTERTASELRLRQFVADASHELRTPLAAVRGYAEMIHLTEPLTENGQELLSRVQSQSERMGELVEQLLLLARLDAAAAQEAAGTVDENAAAAARSAYADIDLGEIVLDAVSDAHAAGRDHEWEADIRPEPVVVNGHREQLSRLISNLLSNARKHTPPHTHVAVRLQADASHAALTVADNGPGIAPDLQGKIFDRFVRGNAARTPAEGSTGLGLSIARSVAEAHGGSLTVQSAPGNTVFTLSLPLAPAQG